MQKLIANAVSSTEAWMIGYAIELLRCIDVEIWRFIYVVIMTDRLLYCCVCARSKNICK